MKITLNIWRQPATQAPGQLERYELDGVSPDMSFLEMFDMLNEQLTVAGKEPVAFAHDCREGICGSCSMMINGQAHGPWTGTATCQLHMRAFKDGDILTVEPWRAAPFPIVKDLVVNRGAFDRIIQAGGFITARAGSAQDANLTPIAKPIADEAMDAAQCIGCGACVAACPNASASLFMAAKVTHLGLLPQGQPERMKRALAMVAQHEKEGFGGCSNHYECESACPKQIPVTFIARMNRDFVKAALTYAEPQAKGGEG